MLIYLSQPFVWDENKLTGDVVQHRQPQEWISEAKNSSCYDWRPVRGLTVTGESKPQESDWEQPDSHQGSDETGFWSIGSVLLSVTSVEPGLDWNEAEHDNHAHDEVEVCEIRTNNSAPTSG